MTDRNYYEVLGVPTDATPEEISRGYQQAKLAFSPDGAAMYSLLSEDECNQMVELIDAAFSILYDSRKRLEYDKAKGITSSSKMKDALEDFSLKEKLEEFAHHDDKKMEEPKINRLVAQKRFALDYVIDEDFEKEIEQTTEFTGEFLKKVRTYRNVSIERLSDMTKVSKNYLISIEEENIDKLPATAYTRGFIYQYAKCLKLSPDLVATSYIYRLKNIRDSK